MLLLGDSSGPERALAMITPRARQAFLLASLEDFSRDEVAHILELSQREVDDLLRDARAQIAQHAVTGVLIIEDKAPIAQQLRKHVEDMGHWVQGVASNLSETRSVISQLERFQLHPGIVLADACLANEASGLEAMKDVMAYGDTCVILIGAPPENALVGMLPKPICVLRDPFSREALNAAISHALFFQGSGPTIVV